MTWSNLNSYYEKIYTKALDLLCDVTAFAPDAKLGWYNLHEVKRNGKFETEFFPMPEVEFELEHAHVDMGVSYMCNVWAELTVSAERAVLMDFCEMQRDWDIEIYGAENYHEDFYHAGMDIENVKEKLMGSGEKEIHILFNEVEENSRIEELIDYIRNI